VLQRHHTAQSILTKAASDVFTFAARVAAEIHLHPAARAECEFLVNAPKLKAHPWTQMTLALKAYIGLQNDAHRLIDHDHMLDAKIADLQDIISPGLIVADAIIAASRRCSRRRRFPGLI